MTIEMNKRRYKDDSMNNVYWVMYALAFDGNGSMYHKDGTPHRGASHRCNFWGGYYGNTRTPERGTLGYAAFMAGKDFAKKCPGIEDTSQPVIGRV